MLWTPSVCDLVFEPVHPLGQDLHNSMLLLVMSNSKVEQSFQTGKAAC